MEPNDYAEIAQLLARYCHIVDAKQWDRLGEIFTGDGSMTVTARFETHRGLAELRELYGVKMNHPVAHNSTSVVVLEASATAARAVSKWVTVRADGLAGSGVYADQLVRTVDGWRIQERVATPSVAPS